MKKLIYFITLLFLSTSVFAQEGEKMGIKLSEFEAVKKIAIKNLDKDTYVKDGNFVLDNSTSPYVFKFSDGLERRIYLYKVLESAGMKEIANLMIFTTPKDGKRINLVVPNPLAEKETWGKYIDDLKDGEKAVSGFSSCVAFVLAKEFSGVASDKGKEEDKYEYCFPAEAKITMANGETKNISDVKVGEYVVSYNAIKKSAESTIVEKIDIHENSEFDIVKVFLVDPSEMITASVSVKYKLKELEATANHPIFTENGKTTMGDLKVGQNVFVYDSETNKFKKFNVFLTKAGARKVNKVYNLITEKNSYLVNSVVVLKK
ncbi:Hint domain-containing protein [Arcicella rosea]|uniref:NACalpha-BTF3-like transcription factor n=1 Tax=Arcicella rosea TaxID=502909 RepID=A0A841EEP3_9BACT|nr:Hint domain-containing protein [Arcicella rosea]MBB6001615.1 NACalpha-BTF3-like transcription factor [Arcicella rosea]